VFQNGNGTAGRGDTFEALSRIGADVAFERVSSVADCVERASREEVDLVVVDRGGPRIHAEVLAALAAESPPVVVVVAVDDDEDDALDAFRCGAADCVRAAHDYAEVLPVVALEQIRRWRQLRERRAAHRRIDWLERYNDNIIQSINSALVVVNRDGRITFANPTAGHILGCRAGDLGDRPVADWFTGGDDGPALITRTLEEGVRFKGAETMITLADGTLTPIGISCTPLLDESGEILGAVAIFQDLSEIKQLQRQVLQQEKMASIGQLAAGVAHEINNPMGFIHANLYQMSEYLQDMEGWFGAVDGLQRAAEAGDAEAVSAASQRLAEIAREIDVDYVRADFKKAVRESQEGSERIRHIVKDLREFSHQGSSERMLADVNQCVDSTANIVWTMMKHSVILEKEYADLPEISCYPMQLKQVFMNLLVNAYQAIEERQAEGDREPGVIRIVSSQRSGGVLVSISDTGIGIAETDLQRIFDPFFTTKEVGTGTGLGLSTSYGIVKRHGGTMNVASEIDRGSTFDVWLPFKPPDDMPPG